jgi:solute carrier family 25 phosphate transporter 23/24/25/41
MKEKKFVSLFLQDEQKLFEKIDEDEDGVISKEEMEEKLLKMNLKINQNLINEIFQKKNTSENNRITLNDFLKFVHQKNKILQKFFTSFDKKSGHLEKHSFSDKHFFSWEEQEKLIKYLNLNKKEKINYEEFLQVYLKNNYLESIIDKFIIKEISISPVIILISGGVAGVVSRTITAPLDRIKILMQVNSMNLTFFQVIKDIWYKENFFAFYKGNGTNIIKIIPETAIKFTFFEKSISYLSSLDLVDINVNRFISGALAGIVSQTFIYPLEICKTRLALADKKYYTGIFDCLRKIIKYEGYRSLYKGWGASSLGIIPYASVDLAVFYFLKEKYVSKFDKQPNVGVLLTMGGFSGALGQFFAYPFALVRTRLQSQGMIHRPVIYNGIVDCLVKTIKNEGYSGLYKGLLPNYLKSIPAVSITYAVFEKSKHFLIDFSYDF